MVENETVNEPIAIIIPRRIDKGPCGISLCNSQPCENWCARKWPHTFHHCLTHISDAIPDFNTGEKEKFAAWLDKGEMSF